MNKEYEKLQIFRIGRAIFCYLCNYMYLIKSTQSLYSWKDKKVYRFKLDYSSRRIYKGKLDFFRLYKDF